MKNIYVVAWEYGPTEEEGGGGGGGFNWYPKIEDRDAAYQEELKNTEQPNLDNWRAIKFDAQVNDDMSRDEITALLDAMIWELSHKQLSGKTLDLTGDESYTIS